MEHIDLLILLKNEEGITLKERMRLIEPLYDIELETGVQINPFIESLQKWGGLSFCFGGGDDVSGCF